MVLLVALALYYNLPNKAYNKLFNPHVESKIKKVPNELRCGYELKYFDFHYKDESSMPEIIMLGTSIVKQGDWTELLDRSDVINRGIAGDNLPCMCQRLEYLKGTKAKIWFIEGGINDLPKRSPKLILEDFKTIIEFVKTENGIPVINLLLYLSPDVGTSFPTRKDYKKINKLIKEINTMLVIYSKNNNLHYIDLNKEISGKNNILKDRYTTDGLHINKLAYEKWALLIKDILEQESIIED